MELIPICETVFSWTALHYDTILFGKVCLGLSQIIEHHHTVVYTHHFGGSITPKDCGCVPFEVGSHWTIITGKLLIEKLEIYDATFAYVCLGVNKLSLGECGHAVAKIKKCTWTASVNAPLGTSLATTRRSVWTLLNDDISLSPYNAIPLFCASRCVHSTA